MDVISSFNSIISSQSSAFIAGAIAAFTPCTLSLIPILLYRFGIWKTEERKEGVKSALKEILLLLLGFMLGLGIAGILLQSLISSNFVNATRLALGTGLVLIGILQISGKVSFQFVANASNPFVIGFVMPWIIGFSPCVLPYFSGLIANSTQSDTVVKFFLFGLGILTPAVGIAFFGNTLVGFVRKSYKFISRLERWSAALIIFAGVYISAELVQLTPQDILIAGGILLLLAGYFTWRILSLPARRTIRNYTTVSLTLLAIVSGTLFLTVSSEQLVPATGATLLSACVASGHVNCSICGIAAVVFNLLAVGIAVMYLQSDRPGKRLRFRY